MNSTLKQENIQIKSDLKIINENLKEARSMIDNLESENAFLKQQQQEYLSNT